MATVHSSIIAWKFTVESLIGYSLFGVAQDRATNTSTQLVEPCKQSESVGCCMSWKLSSIFQVKGEERKHEMQVTMNHLKNISRPT